jgi:predicted AAA+ superfamily ATPase
MVRRELGEYAAFIASKPWLGDTGISQPTARQWLSILENSFIVFNLQPYQANIRKRLVKSQVMK